MADDRILSSIDGHIAQINEHVSETKVHIAQSKKLMTRGNELMQEVREELALNRKERSEFQLFIRDMTRRNELVLGNLAAESAAGRQLLIDVHEEAVTQRQATFTLIDELRRHGLGGGR